MNALAVPLLAVAGGAVDAIAARVFLAIAVIVVVGRVAGLAFRRLGQPVVVGEILAGVSLGPSVLGLLPGDLPDRLFPLEVRPYLQVAAELGLIIFMFLVGLEIDADSLRRSGRRAVVLSLSSIAVPMLLSGLVLAPLLYERYGSVDGQPVDFAPFALFLGVAMSGTAFAVLARILTERNMFRIPLGMLALACAAIDDIVVFALLAIVVSVAGSGGLTDLPISLGELVLFTIVLFAVVGPLLERTVIRRYRLAGRLSPDMLAVLVAGALASAYVAHLIGLAALIGAFLFGAAVPRRDAGSLGHDVAERVEGVSVVVLLPVFFVVTGLGVDVRGLGWSGLVPLLGILAVACAGKFLGGGLAARLMGVSTRQSLALATLMNTRGLTELVILNVGRSVGLIDGPLFTMMVIMAIATTVLAGPLLAAVYPPRLLQRDIADAERNRGGDAATYRVAVVVDADAAIEPLIVAARGAIGPERPAEVSIVALLDGRDMQRLGATMAAVQPRRRRLEADGIDVRAIVRFAADPTAELLEELSARPVDCVVVGWSPAPVVVDAIQDIAAADLADLVVVAGIWPEAPPGATAAGAVLGDLRGPDAPAVAEHTARWARFLHGGVVTMTANRTGRAMVEQLARAGFPVLDAGDASAPAGAEVAVTVAGLGVDTEVRTKRTVLDVVTVARAAAAVSPLLLVRGRQGERQTVAERVVLQADVAHAVEQPAPSVP